MHWHLADTVDFLRLRQAGSFQNCRSDVRAVSELAAQTAFVLNAFWPADDHWVANAPEVRGHLLSPFERRVPGPRPRCRVMRIHIRAAPFFETAISFDCFYLLLSAHRIAV